jgi:hypothetical protein
MNVHEVIEFPTHLGYPVSKIWSLSTLIAIFSYHCVCRALTHALIPTLPVTITYVDGYQFFSASKPIIALRGGCFPVVVILGTSEVFPGASMATVSFDRFIFLWAAEQKISSSFVREFSDGRKRAVHIAQRPF